MQPLHFIERHVGAGRIIGIGQEYDLGALAHGRQHGVDIGGVILLSRHHGACSRAKRGNGINQKAMRRVDRLIAIAQIGVGNEVQQIVRARAANNALGIKPEGAADCLTQRDRGAVGIVLQMRAGCTVGSDRLGTGAERSLIG